MDFARGAIAALDQAEITSHGHAIECRIYAENPARHFMPSPGTLERFRLPSASAEVRIDSGYREGDRVTHFYDPLIAKVICHGSDRAQAIECMVEALTRTDIAGIATNVAFLRSTVGHPRFREGDVSTAFIDDCRRELITAHAA
jgi:3-methylcrotonyl-CoA carboxylase alpha subunit